MKLIGAPIVDVVTYRYAGQDVFDMEANRQLHIKAHNTDVLKISVPSGKKWKVSITVDISEILP